MPKIKELLVFKLLVEVSCDEETDPEIYADFKSIIATRLHYAVHQQQSSMVAKLLELSEERKDKKE